MTRTYSPHSPLRPLSWLQRVTCLTIVLSGTACAPQVAESPHVSLQNLRRAVEAGDTVATLAYVDLDAIAARLMRDVVRAVEDSIRRPFPDSLSTNARNRLDSLKALWQDAFRMDLGLPPITLESVVPSDTLSPGSDPEPWHASPDESEIATEAEIVGDGAARYQGDTAVVSRVLRYGHLDTTVILQLALIPVERRYWRLVAMPNVVATALALEARKVTVLARANRPRRDSIAARLDVTQLSVTREPLEEWDRYAAHVRVTVRNHSPEPVTVRAAHLLGPRLALDDTVGAVLREPIRLRPGQETVLVWQRPLRGDQVEPYDVVARPDSYTVEVTAIETHGTRGHRVELYRTWDEYVSENPLPARPSGVLAAHFRQNAAEPAVEADRRL